MIAAEEFFERLRAQIKDQLPFVAYRDPESKPIATKAILQPDAEIYKTSNFTESGFVFAPFEDKEEAILIPSEGSEIIKTVFEDSEDGPDLINNADIQITSSEEKDQHIKLVEKGIKAIENQIFKKVVLSRKETIELKDPDPVRLFQKLLQKYSSAFVYIWYHPKNGLWMGATPETLLKVERNIFKTMALAATRKFEGNIDVEWGEKEKEEQRFVTDSILENLFEVPVENVEMSRPYTSRAANLLHLRTDISGKITSEETSYPQTLSVSKEGNLERLIKAIHPTPAVCGLPKEPAKKFILKNEYYDREFYTGFLGEINMKQTIQRSSNRKNRENQAYSSVINKTSLFVNLRCMKIEQNTAVIFVGGGITKESDPVAEWIETENKADTMKAVLLK